MQHLKIVSVNRPKQAKGDEPAVTGVSNVIVERESAKGVMTQTVVGHVYNERNIPGFTAALIDGTAVDGKFETRSKAGHAVRSMAQADERAAKALAKADAKPAKVAKTPAASTPTLTDDEKKANRNERRRQLRAAKKAAANG